MFFKDLSIKVKLIMITFIGILLITVPSIIIIRMGISNDVKEVAINNAKANKATGYAILDEKYSGDWRLEGDKLYKGTILINDNNEIVDYIGELTGNKVGIFANNISVSTNIKENGKRVVNKVVSDIVAEVVLGEGKDYYGEENIVGHIYQTVYTPIKNSQGKIIGIWYTGTSSDFVNNIINNTSKKLSYIIIAMMFVMLLLIYFGSNIITVPINELTLIMNRLANYDLSFDTDSKENEYLKRKDEIGKIANQLAIMQKNLISLVNNIKGVSEQMVVSSEELSNSGEQVDEAAEQVGSAIQNVASGAEEQSAQIEETSKGIEVMVKQIQQVNSNSDIMINSAKDVTDIIDLGNRSVEKSIKEINNVKSDTIKVAGIIQSLGDTSDKIGSIIGMINEIANQTNLLALNAAIEAARAGEAGRGFSVVSDEIRELAEESTKSTEKIESLINQIQSDVANAVDKMNVNTKTVNNSVSLIEKNGQVFNDIRQVFKDLVNLISGVRENANELAEHSDKIADITNNVAAVSQEAAGNAEEVAASSEEQIASTEEIVSESKAIADMAEQLNKLLDKFKLN